MIVMTENIVNFTKCVQKNQNKLQEKKGNIDLLIANLTNKKMSKHFATVQFFGKNEKKIRHCQLTLENIKNIDFS